METTLIQDFQTVFSQALATFVFIYILTWAAKLVFKYIKGLI